MWLINLIKFLIDTSPINLACTKGALVKEDEGDYSVKKMSHD